MWVEVWPAGSHGQCLQAGGSEEERDSRDRSPKAQLFFFFAPDQVVGGFGQWAFPKPLLRPEVIKDPPEAST